MEPTAERGDLTQRVRAAFAPGQVLREVSMFGGLSFMIDGGMAVAARTDGDLLVRVDPAAYDELLQQGAMPAFMGTGRPMGRGWISVPGARIAEESQLAYWVGLGIDSRNVET